MSIVAAIKKDGVVYLGADTRTSCGSKIETCLLPSNRKIQRLGSCYVGATGKVANLQLLEIHPEWFELCGEPLTKRFLVREVVPKYYAALRSAGYLEAPDDGGTLNSECSFLVTDGKRIFRINHALLVIEEGEWGAIGCTQGIALACFAATPDAEPRERLLAALRKSAHWHEGVGAPYLLVDTAENHFEIVEE